MDRGNVATHGAPGVIDEIGADERASNVVGEEEVDGIGDGGHGAVLRPVGQEEVQRIGSALQAFVGSHVADQIAEEIGRHRDRNGQRGGRLAVHDQHRNEFRRGDRGHRELLGQRLSTAHFGCAALDRVGRKSRGSDRRTRARPRVPRGTGYPRNRSTCCCLDTASE